MFVQVLLWYLILIISVARRQERRGEGLEGVLRDVSEEVPQGPFSGGHGRGLLTRRFPDLDHFLRLYCSHPRSAVGEDIEGVPVRSDPRAS